MSYRFFSSKWSTWLLIFTIFSSYSNSINAQEPEELSQGELAAVLSVFNMLLLDSGKDGSLQIAFGTTDNNSYGFNYGQGNYKNGLDIELPLNDINSISDLGIQICFNAVDIQNNELSAEFNGENIGSLVNGENCFTIEKSDLRANNILKLIHNNPGDRWGINTISINNEVERLLTLPTLNRAQWDELAVKHVLQVFAYGGHPTAAQIQIWADMPAKDAIKEMLNFEPHNVKLSPLAVGEKYPEIASTDGTFWEFREFLADENSNLPISNNNTRSGFGVNSWNIQGAWVRMATTRGLNPFRQKIGLWETNYHLAVNSDAGVHKRLITYYYDLIMNAHASGMPYQDVIAEAAKSAAVAYQYDHRKNRWISRNGEYICECNEDFAREIHQLFFGILGEQDPEGIEHHENVTIPETAKALTDMPVNYDTVNQRRYDVVTFGTQYHHHNTVKILNTNIRGANAAAKINAIAQVAINHPESLENLPVIIISGLADDELNASETMKIQRAWAAMPSKNFLEFIQAYAVSNVFHSPDRVKYFTSIDRFINMGNKLILNNTESLNDEYRISAGWAAAKSFSNENVEAFQPLHNVFGGQTGIEASDSAAVLENNYNRFTVNEWYQRHSHCETCDNNGEWQKDWASVVPKTNGVFRVENVAEWLWHRFINDGGKNYTQLERAHLISLLSTRRDLNQLYCVKERRIAEGIEPSSSDINQNFTPLQLLERDNPYSQTTGRRCDSDYKNATERFEQGYSSEEIALLEKGFSNADLEAPDMVSLFNEMANRTLDLESQDIDDRRRANQTIGRGINFILSTPFIMAQEAQ